MADWNSQQYLKFEKERTQPSIDLVNRITLKNPKKILDIGCGPGNSTHVLAEKFPKAYILGIDNSPDMIAAAKLEYPLLDFMIYDANHDLSLIRDDFDIVFSNAAIHWVPNHKVLLKEMIGVLRPGGFMAVQIPIHERAAMYAILDEITESKKWKGYFGEKPRYSHSLTYEEYYDILYDISSDFSMWSTMYFHTLGSHRDIIEWYRGSGLRPYLEILPEEKRDDFEQEVMEHAKKAYNIQKDGQVLLPFPRFFFTATK